MADEYWRQKTIATYDKSAARIAGYFRSYGSRDKDIRLVFELIGLPKDPLVVEIGCAGGRDAKEIVKYTERYVGFDPAKNLIKLAREYLPQAQFKIGDAVNFSYPKDIDAVFAFASLLHLDIKEFKSVVNKLSRVIKPGGVLYLSLKYSPNYREEIKRDEYGERMFYFYNSKLIKGFTDKEFEVIYLEEGKLHGKSKDPWLEMALRKK